MSIGKAKDFYQQLTPQQKHFVDNKTISTTLSIKHWVAFLSKVNDYDLYDDKARNTLGIYIGICVIGLIASAILLANFFQVYLVIIPVVLIILLINTIQTRKTFVNRDINNYLRVYFLPLLDSLKSKTGDDAKLSASLDFRDPFRALKPEKYKVPYQGRDRRVELYEPKLVIAGVMLRDQSYLETVLVDEIKKISYTNPRGKSKSKIKTLHRLFIRLTVSKELYRRNAIALPDYVEMSEEDNAYIFKLKHKGKELNQDILHPSIFFSELNQLYRLIQPLAGRQDSTEVATEPSEAQTNPASNLVEALVWNDLIFDSYDYDGLRNRDRSLTAGDDSGNIFDS
jgi:hypothetical protein